jgi:hypothetical protein
MHALATSIIAVARSEGSPAALCGGWHNPADANTPRTIKTMNMTAARDPFKLFILTLHMNPVFRSGLPSRKGPLVYFL